MPSLSTWDKIGPKTNTFYLKKYKYECMHPILWAARTRGVVGSKTNTSFWGIINWEVSKKCVTRNRKAPHCFYRTRIQSLPWLSVSPSVTPHFELCWNCWICQSCYMDFSKLLLGFVKVDTCISLSCYIEQTFPFCQSSGISVCILFYLLVINKDR